MTQFQARGSKSVNKVSLHYKKKKKLRPNNCNARVRKLNCLFAHYMHLRKTVYSNISICKSSHFRQFRDE